MRILFITHEASNTGAPILFLNLIKAIKKYQEFDINILTVKDGPLIGEFRKLGETGYIKASDYKKEKSAIRKYINKLGFTYRLIKNKHLWKEADIVFNNTVWNGKILNFYSRQSKKPIISYLHELVNSIGELSNNIEARYTFQHSAALVSPSAHNIDALSSRYKISMDKFTVLPYLMLTKHKFDENEKRKARALLCDKFKLDPATKLVLGMGTFDLRKGADYFIETARLLENKQTHFFWIGHINDEKLFSKMQNYIQKHNITNFHYLGAFSHSLTNFYPYDVLFLSSREDPYPLVVLEAGMAEIPTIYFEQSGGIGEFVKDDAGWPVNSFYPTDASVVINNITVDEISKKGKRAHSRVSDWHMNDDNIYAAFKAIINENMNEG